MASITKGLTEKMFKDGLKKHLVKSGWYGGKYDDLPDTPENQLKKESYLNWRLGVIFRTNLSTAYAAGKYRQMSRITDMRPIWVYSALLDKRTRDAHRALHNKAFRHDDPFWSSYYPPNGWNCRCMVYSLTESDAKARGFSILSSDKNGNPPNNWTSFFAEDAWQKDETSGEYYLHLFSKKQPDLNYHNPEVLEEIKSIMRFWLDKGISGFRCDVINIIWKSSLADGKKRFILTGKEHYLSRDGAHRILKVLRKEVLDNYDCFTVGETVFVTPEEANDLCGENSKELDMVFSFEHMECDQIIVKWFTRKFKPERLFKVLNKWQNGLSWNALYFENHDQPRSVSRFIKDEKFMTEGAKALAMLLFTLRGTPYVFQGQEIGMTNFDIESLDQVRDIESHNVYKLARKLHFPKWYAWKMIQKKSRDNARTPIQWNNTQNAGFTEGNPWIKINKNYNFINIENQIQSNESVLSFYKKMITLRKESPLLIDGEFRVKKISGSLFVYERFIDVTTEYKNTHTYDTLKIIINMSNKNKKYKAKGKVLLSTYGRDSYNDIIFPYEGIILY